MLVNTKCMLQDAQNSHYAVGSFNVYNYETIKGVADSVKELKNPAIIAFGERYLENMGFDTVCSIVKTELMNTGTEAALHLDHCSRIENIYKAIRAGFTSVMYDGSSLDYESNVRNTAKIAEIAHACDVTVEAELGSLAAGEKTNEGKVSDKEIYTDASQARDFVQRTKVDSLAVSIGTVHGFYKGVPNIRVGILKDIQANVDVPLVLHGGSGIPESIILECIQNGICKINVNTEISDYTVKSLKGLFDGGKYYHLSILSLKEVQYVKDVVKKYMLLFKS